MMNDILLSKQDWLSLSLQSSTAFTDAINQGFPIDDTSNISLQQAILWLLKKNAALQKSNNTNNCVSTPDELEEAKISQLKLRNEILSKKIQELEKTLVDSNLVEKELKEWLIDLKNQIQHISDQRSTSDHGSNKLMEIINACIK